MDKDLEEYGTENLEVITDRQPSEIELKAMKFANKIADLAEEANHHPDILISWGKCKVNWWTFDYKRLHENDFIMAARTEMLFQSQAD